MGKIKYNSAVVKKVAIFAIIGIVLILVVVSIIRSYSNNRQITTNSVEIDEKIPAGEYQNYIKRSIRPGFNESRLRLLDLNDDDNQSRINKRLVKSKNFDNITLTGADAIDGIYDPENNTITVPNYSVIFNYPGYGDFWLESYDDEDEDAIIFHFNPRGGSMESTVMGVIFEQGAYEFLYLVMQHE